MLFPTNLKKVLFDVRDLLLKILKQSNLSNQTLSNTTPKLHILAFSTTHFCYLHKGSTPTAGKAANDLARAFSI